MALNHISALSKEYSPSFRLLVNPEELQARYQSGGCGKIVIPETPIMQYDNKSIVTKNYSTNLNDPVYSIIDRNNTHIIIATTNQQHFTMKLTGNKILSSDGRAVYNCNWCRKDFNDDPKPCIVDLKSLEIDGKIQYVGIGVGTFHSLSCADGFAEAFKHKFDIFRNCEVNHRIAYSLLYPGKKLVTAPMYTLHKRNGGSLTDEEFDDPQYRYIPMNGLTFQPAKQNFQRVSDP
jgi:hypothetical protein